MIAACMRHQPQRGVYEQWGDRDHRACRCYQGEIVRTVSYEGAPNMVLCTGMFHQAVLLLCGQPGLDRIPHPTDYSTD